ncbi:MAG: putative PEP-binding protein, partial [Clostridia bacterium]
LPMQRSDFEALFRTMSPFPVTIRFLDPPLHEFLPSEEGELQTLAKQMNLSIDILRAKVESLKEFNPMMGHRGCRLAVSYSEIAEMQTTAVMEAAINTIREGYNVEPEIMIPLIGDPKELQYVKNIVTTTAQATLARNDFTMSYKVGTMIEIPRAALLADEIAVDAEFFSFGTNDLTQLTFGFSRDDAGTFLEHYYTKKIFEQDPFARLDRAGVGKLVKMAAKLGRETRPDIKLGICGEHGGDPSSVEFCHQIGLDYVSCSPFRVPIARLAAAQAALQEKK